MTPATAYIHTGLAPAGRWGRGRLRLRSRPRSCDGRRASARGAAAGAEGAAGAGGGALAGPSTAKRTGRPSRMASIS